MKPTPLSSPLVASRRVASERAEAYKRRLARIRACRRERLASEIANEKEALSSTSNSRRSTACGPYEERGTPRNLLSHQQRLETETTEEREMRLVRDQFSHQQRLAAIIGGEGDTSYPPET